VDLFQLLASSSRTGRLGIDHPEGKARVYFDKGRVLHAEFNDRIGEEAVYALFADERGSFEFQVGLPAPETTVTVATENLMLEAIRRLDESSRDSSMIPDEVVPLYAENVPSASTLSLQPQEVSLLQLINGQLTVLELATQAKTHPEEVKRIIDRLVRAGVLKLREKRPRTARLVTRLVRQELPTGVVGLDTNILANWQRVMGTEPTQVACRRADGKVLTFKVQPMNQVGPYILLSMETLALANLSVNAALLVKPL
jgi:hypothetical protein